MINNNCTYNSSNSFSNSSNSNSRSSIRQCLLRWHPSSSRSCRPSLSTSNSSSNFIRPPCLWSNSSRWCSSKGFKIVRAKKKRVKVIPHLSKMTPKKFQAQLLSNPQLEVPRHRLPCNSSRCTLPFNTSNNNRSITTPFNRLSSTRWIPSYSSNKWYKTCNIDSPSTITNIIIDNIIRRILGKLIRRRVNKVRTNWRTLDHPKLMMMRVLNWSLMLLWNNSTS